MEIHKNRGFPQDWKSLRLSHFYLQARRRSTTLWNDLNKNRGLQEVKTEILILTSLRRAITIIGITDHDSRTADHDHRNTQLIGATADPDTDRVTVFLV